MKTTAPLGKMAVSAAEVFNKLISLSLQSYIVCHRRRGSSGSGSSSSSSGSSSSSSSGSSSSSSST